MMAQIQNLTNRQLVRRYSTVSIKNLLVGDELCEYTTICDVLTNTKASGALYPKLRELALSLRLRRDDVVRIFQGDRTQYELLFEVLEAWRSVKSSNARLGALMDILEMKGLNDCADSLRKRFRRKLMDVGYLPARTRRCSI